MSKDKKIKKTPTFLSLLFPFETESLHVALAGYTDGIGLRLRDMPPSFEIRGMWSTESRADAAYLCGLTDVKSTCVLAQGSGVPAPTR